LNGADQAVPATQVLDVVDGSGSGSGWNVTLTSTTFTSGSLTLADGSASDQSATGTCDPSVTCTLADNSAASYPLAIPSGATAPTAVEIMSAGVGTGLGGQPWTHNMRLAVKANAKAASIPQPGSTRW
jgi:hypothetical protein